MELKKNYFLRNMVDLEKNLSTYLKDADFNYVILEKNIPLVWGDKTPVVFGGEMDVINELMELDAFADVEKNILKPDFKVLTEQDFIETFCLDAVANYIAKLVISYGNFDGTNFLVNTDDSFNGIIDRDGMTDILGIYASNNSNSELSILISSEDDKKREFITLLELDFNTIVKIVKFVELIKEN